MELILYENFSKRSNSTKRPTGGYSVNVKLKNNTSVESPVFFIDGVNLSVNYCKWDNNYYFITDIVLGNNNIYELHCTIDVLASYKEYILNTDAYIEYSTVGDTTLPDNRIPVKTNPTITIHESDDPIFDEDGAFYATVTGEGSVGTYRIDDKSNLNKLVFNVDDLYPAQVGDTVADAIATLGKNIIGCGTISENIRNCFWMPAKAVTTSQSEHLHLGIYESACYGKSIDIPVQSADFYLPIPWQFSDWRNTSPYTEMYIYLPYIGIVSLNPSNFVGGTNLLRVTRALNVSSGTVEYRLRVGHTDLGNYSANITIPIPIGSSNINPVNAAGSIIAGAGALLSSATMGEKVLSVASSTLSGLKTLNTNAGGTGGGAGFKLGLKMVIINITHGTTVEPSTFATIWGYPYGRIDKISNHSGYIQCSDFSCDAPLHDDERNQLNALLNSGIYLE